MGAHPAPRAPRPHDHLERTPTAPAARGVHRALQRASTPPKPQPTSTRRRVTSRDRPRPTDPTAHHLRRTHQRVPHRSLNHPAAPAHHRDGSLASSFTAPAGRPASSSRPNRRTQRARDEFSAPSGRSRSPPRRATTQAADVPQAPIAAALAKGVPVERTGARSIVVRITYRPIGGAVAQEGDADTDEPDDRSEPEDHLDRFEIRDDRDEPRDRSDDRRRRSASAAASW